MHSQTIYVKGKFDYKQGMNMIRNHSNLNISNDIASRIQRCEMLTLQKYDDKLGAKTRAAESDHHSEV